MKILEIITSRSSVRKFEPQPIERDKLTYILEAARLAPSAVNFQPWHFIVVTDPEILCSIHATYPRDWIKTAPAIIVALGNHNKGWRRKTDGKDFTEIDVAIAIEHLILAATEQNLGTCWVCNFDVEKCCEIFNLPSGIEPIALIPIGYSIETLKSEKWRIPLQEMVSWNNFQQIL